MFLERESVAFSTASTIGLQPRGPHDEASVSDGTRSRDVLIKRWLGFGLTVGLISDNRVRQVRSSFKLGGSGY